MENYQRTTELINVATNSEGRADEQFAKYADTVELKLNRLKNTWEQLRISMLNSDTYKSVLDLVNKILEKLNTMSKFELSGLAVGVVAGGRLLLNLVTKALTEVTNNIGATIERVKNKTIDAIFSTTAEITNQKIGQKFVKEAEEARRQIDQKIIEIDNRIKALNDNKIKISVDSSAIRTQIQNIQTQIQSSQTQMGNLQGQAQNLETQRNLILSRRREFNNSKDYSNFYMQQSNSLIRDTGLDPDAIKQQLNSQGYYKSFTQANTQIASFDRQINSLNTQINSLKTQINDSNTQINNLNLQLEDNERTTERNTKEIQQQTVKKKNEVANRATAEANVAQAKNKSNTILSQTRKEQYSSTVSSASVAFSTALISAFTSDKVTSVIKSTATTTALSLIPSLFSSAVSMKAEGFLISTIVKVLGSNIIIAAILASVAMAVGSAIVLIKKEIALNKELSPETYKKNLSETQQSVGEITDELRNASKEAKEQLDTTEKLKERYEELSNKVILTSEEQEEYTSLVEQIRTEMPEIVSYYNEATGELKVQNELWDSILEKQKQLYKQQQISAIESTIASLNLEQVNNTNNSWEDFKNTYGIHFREEFDVNSIKSLEDFIEIMNRIEDSRNGGIDLGYIDHSAEETWDDNGGVDAYNAFLKARDEANNIDDYLKQLSEQMVSLMEINGKVFESDAERAAYELDVYTALKNKQEQIKLLNSEDVWQNETRYGRGNVYSFIGKNSSFDDLNTDTKSVKIGNEEEISAKTFREYLLRAFGAATENGKIVYSDPNTAKAIEQARQFYEDNQKETEGQKEILNRIFGVMISDTSGNIIEDNSVLKNLPEKDQKDIVSLMNKITNGDYSKNDVDVLKNTIMTGYQTIYGDSDEIKKQAEDYADEFVKDYNEEIEKKSADLKFLFGDKTTISKEEYEKAQAVYDSFSEQIGSGSASLIKEILQKGLTEGLDIKTILSVLQQDFSNIGFGQLSTFKDNTLDIIEELQGEAYNKTKAKEFTDFLSKQLQSVSVLDMGLKNATDFETLTTEISDKIGEIISVAGDLSSIAESQIKNGKLTGKEYKDFVSKIEKAELGLNASDYIENTSKGLVLNVDKLKNDLNEILTEQDKVNSLAKTEAQNRIASLKSEEEILKKQLSLLNPNEKITEQILNNLEKYANLNGLTFEDLTGYGKDSFSIYDSQQKLYDAIKKQLDSINLEKTSYENAYANNKNTEFAKSGMIEVIDSLWNTPYKELEEDIKEAYDDILDLEKDIVEVQEDIKEAYEDIAEAEKNVAEKVKELNEALYGTDLWKSSLDSLYNYSTLLDNLSNKADKAKESLSDLERDSNISELLSNYSDAVHQEAVVLNAENSVLDQAINNYMSVLSSQYSDYFYQLGDRVAVNWANLVNAPMNDALKDYVASSVEQINKLKDQQDQNLDSIEKRQKEFKEQRKTAIDNFVSLEDKVVSILKKKYQEEIDSTKSKYDAMKEADDDYLDALESAIDKQKQLRERQNEWDELGTKEKKLSLLQRDTSGSNQKEQLELQKDIENSRQDLLDNTIDDIVNSLKELYELQQETREAEIEYQEAVLENGTLIKEANDIIMNQWQSPDDAINWFYNNNPEVLEMSEARLEQYTMEIETAFAEKDAYLQASAYNFETALQTEQYEIENAINVVSETLTNEAWRSAEETNRAVAETQENAREALNDAQDGLTDAYTKLDENISKLKELESQLSEARETYNNAIGDIKDTSISALIDSNAVAEEIHQRNLARLEEENAVISANKFQERLNKLDQTYNREGDEAGYQRARAAIINAAYANATDRQNFRNTFAYASGGLVDYTGPAWVDGTKSEPEAFLSAEDTKRIGEAAELLSKLPILNKDFDNNDIVQNTVGDTNIEIHINVDSISNDYDIDQAVERVQQKILEVSRPTGSSVILRK